MKSISVVTPCFNEAGNVSEVYERVRAIMRGFNYRYEHIFIDNASTDGTLAELRGIASRDRNVKVIANARNFGQVRSPHYALLQATGDAVILLESDLQHPPELIGDMIREWERGTPVVIGVKESKEENALMFRLRKLYYRLLNKLTEVETYENYVGFGLYDRKVMEIVKTFRDPYPYFRGIIAEIGLPHVEIKYRQLGRKRGFTKNGFFSLFEIGMLGTTSLTKLPLRLVTLIGLAGAIFSKLVALGYLIYKFCYWDSFQAGVAPIMLGMFFIASSQLMFLGILGEYIGSIHTLVQNRPLVIERERINFEFEPGEPS